MRDEDAIYGTAVGDPFTNARGSQAQGSREFQKRPLKACIHERLLNWHSRGRHKTTIDHEGRSNSAEATLTDPDRHGHLGRSSHQRRTHANTVVL